MKGNKNNFFKIKKEIERIINNSYSNTELSHARGTLKWVLKIKTNADEALQIASLAHDIERGGKEKRIITKKIDNNENFSDYDIKKKKHATKSAKIIAELLEIFDVKKEIIKRVKYLVKNHEIGGDEDANILRDADSLSYFEDNFDAYFKYYGKEKTKHKIDYMYNRISEKRKKLCKKLYNKALKKLV